MIYEKLVEARLPKGYRISNTGIVINKVGKVLKTFRTNSGYEMIILTSRKPVKGIPNGYKSNNK